MSNRNKLYFILIIFIIDLGIIFFTETRCPNIILSFYIKAFLVQFIACFIIYFHTVFQKLLKLYSLPSNTIFYFLLVILPISFVWLMLGETGVYTFGGQDYCNLSDVPKNMKPKIF